MAITGGDVVEITFNHPTIGSGTIFAKSGEDNTYDPGGFRSADDAAMITGAGEMIDTMSRVRPFFEVVVANDMNTREDLEKVAALASSPTPAQWTFSIVNGVSFGMEGKPVGDIQGNITKATFTLKVAGSNKTKKRNG